MKYLFFDIECSNCFGGIGKMCEFGYVLMDEQFKVLKMGDIPMSPGKGRENRFNLIGRKHEKDLILAYEYDFYLSQPEFPAFYEQIRKLMEDPETICFAYSMDNDIPHLYNACRRYRKEPFNYTCYDVQKLVSVYLERKGQMALKKACIEIVGPNTVARLQEHLSRDDSQMEKLIFEAICVFEKKTPSQLLEVSEFAKTNSMEFIRKTKEKKERKRLKAAGHDLYRTLISDEATLDNPENFGRRYNVSGKLKANFKELRVIIDIVQKKDGLFSNHLTRSDYFIVLDEENKEEILEQLSSPFEGQIITYKDFLEMNQS